MNGISSELGLSRGSWVNAHGLTEKGHLSTAHDMAILFAAHKRDFPAYFNLFRRVRTHAGLREVENSAARLLTEIDGIRGAKYGYSRAAGFNGQYTCKYETKNSLQLSLEQRDALLLQTRCKYYWKKDN